MSLPIIWIVLQMLGKKLTGRVDATAAAGEQKPGFLKAIGIGQSHVLQRRRGQVVSDIINLDLVDIKTVDRFSYAQ